MRISRINLTKSVCTEGLLVRLAGAERHYLCDVLRLGVGAKVEVRNGNSQDKDSNELLLCEISKLSDEQVELRIESRRALKPQPAPTLLIGLPKSSVIDLVVEKAAELGVRQIEIFAAERTQGRDALQKLRGRSERLSRIAAAALSQSESEAPLPEFVFHDSLAAALGALHRASQPTPGEWRALLSAPRGRGPNWPDFIGAAGGLQPEVQNADSYLIVGPEGGLTPAEEQTALNFGYRPLVLSANVLRVETAAILGIGTLNWLRLTAT